MTDSELILGLRNRDEEAFKVLIDRYQRLVFFIAARILRDDTEAEDTMQDIFLEIWKQFHLFDESKGTLKTWVERYAITRSVNRRERLKFRHFYDSEPFEDKVSPRGGGQEAAIYVNQLLARLTPPQQQAVRLMGVQGLTLNEAVVVMRHTLAAVNNHYFRGMKALRKLAGESL